jgi:ParB-like chromosome segregation protein Spo0J
LFSGTRNLESTKRRVPQGRDADPLRPQPAHTHTEAQIAKIAASIVEYGWTNPILVDGGNGIIAGHGRLAAAHKLGLAEVPVIELAHLSAAQKRA